MTAQDVSLLLADLALILLLAMLFGHLVVRLRQPPVVGEILAGIALGPSFLPASWEQHLFRPDVRTVLTGVADIGLVLFLVVVGMQIDLPALRGRGASILGTAAGATVVPFGLGLAVSGYLVGTEYHAARWFVGMALSVSAFPVMARILTDRGLAATMIGWIALAVGATVDVFAWCGLAVVQAAERASGQHWLVLLLIPFAVTLATVVRPVLRRVLAERPGGQPQPLVFPVVASCALLSAAVTQEIGLQFIFGAFFFGATLPRRRWDASRLMVTERAGQITNLLLPIYFLVAGSKVDLSGLTRGDLVRLAVILAVATFGKLGGTYAGARMSGLPHRVSASLAALLNTRGLTELVILSSGLQMGLITQKFYSLMVVMALVTTALTGTLLNQLRTEPGDVPVRTGADAVGSAIARAAIANDA